MAERLAARDPGAGARADGPALAGRAHAGADRPRARAGRGDGRLGHGGRPALGPPGGAGARARAGPADHGAEREPTGQLPPTTAAEVLAYFPSGIELVLDGGRHRRAARRPPCSMSPSIRRACCARAPCRSPRARDRRHPGRRQEHAHGRRAEGAARAGRTAHHRAGAGRASRRWWTMCSIVTNTPALYAFLGVPMVADVYPDHGSLGGIFSGPGRRVRGGGVHRRLRHAVPASAGGAAGRRRGRARPTSSIPRVGEQLETMHALYAKACLPHIEARLKARRLKIVGILRGASAWWRSRRRTVARLRAPDVVFMNVNTPEELARARALAAELG